MEMYTARDFLASNKLQKVIHMTFDYSFSFLSQIVKLLLQYFNLLQLQSTFSNKMGRYFWVPNSRGLG